jgi:hypothetical protein
MIQRPAGDLEQFLDWLRRYAALSGPFDPGEALDAVPGLQDADTSLLVTLSAHLANACDTQYGGDSGMWLMRDAQRRRVLEKLVGKDEPAADQQGSVGPMPLHDAIQWRQTLSADQSTTDLLDALTGQGPLAPAAVDAAIRTGGPKLELQRIAVALDRAGPLAPAHERVDAVKAILLDTDAKARDRVLLEHGFVGRQPERTAIADWIARPTSSPVTALFVTGIPGIGKSTLLEQAVLDATGATPPLTVRLDFDRAGLDVLDPTGLTIELSRQIGGQLPEAAGELRRARFEAAGVAVQDAPSKVFRPSRLPESLMGPLVQAVSTAGRTVLLVLDTLEVLRGRGETHPERLFEWLDQLYRAGVVPMAVVAAGRGDALDSAPARIGRRIELTGLEDPDAERLLDRYDIPRVAYPSILEVADGSPLVLGLAATLVQQAGTEAWTKATSGKRVTAAYLYRFLLSRIDDKPLRRLAHPGLIARRINAAFIAEVLAPQLGLGRIDAAEADRLFAALESHHWLVQPDAEGWVRPRSDMRRVLLPLIYRDAPARAARIDRAASAWFGRRPEPWAAIESAYHRLQLMRSDPSFPRLDPGVLARLDDAGIAELPTLARDVVHQSLGERSSQFRDLDVTKGGGSTVEPGAAGELSALIERRDWREAEYVYQRTFAVGMYDVRSPDADVARTFLWRAGRWHEAKRLLDERDVIGIGDDDLFDLAPMIALARLEMRAEFRFGALVDALGRGGPLVRRALDLASAGASSELGAGALGFALRRAGISAPPRSDQPDVVGDIVAAYSAEGRRWSDTGTLRLAQSRLANTMQPAGSAESTSSSQPAEPLDPASDAAVARLFATLTPYASPAGVLLQLQAKAGVVARLTDDLYRVSAGLVRLDRLPPTGANAWHPKVTTETLALFDELVGTGLFAEWAGAAVTAVGDPDLRLVARAAERWRRTAAGAWAYGGSPPRDPQPWNRRQDASIVDRVASLDRAPDPRAAAIAQLAAWMGVDDGTAVTARLQRRYATSLARATAVSATDATVVAEQLLRRPVPAAFIPALATLATTQP